jgi:hypothetical protein
MAVDSEDSLGYLLALRKRLDEMDQQGIEEYG